jgi:hypothetical protein
MFGPGVLLSDPWSGILSALQNVALKKRDPLALPILNAAAFAPFPEWTAHSLQPRFTGPPADAYRELALAAASDAGSEEVLRAISVLQVRFPGRSRPLDP